MMKFRNDHQYELMRRFYERAAPDFPFKTFVFENPHDFGMNWFQAQEDIEGMEAALHTGPNMKMMDALEEWWRNPTAHD